MLLFGAPGSGKSDLLLRLLDHGYTLVADDQVHVEHGVASPPPSIAGLIEVRGLGILRMPFTPSARLVLAIELDTRKPERLPTPQRRMGLPLVHIDPAQPSAPSRVTAALRCALGEIPVVAGSIGSASP